MQTHLALDCKWRFLLFWCFGKSPICEPYCKRESEYYVVGYCYTGNIIIVQSVSENIPSLPLFNNNRVTYLLKTECVCYKYPPIHTYYNGTDKTLMHGASTKLTSKRGDYSPVWTTFCEHEASTKTITSKWDDYTQVRCILNHFFVWISWAQRNQFDHK